MTTAAEPQDSSQRPPADEQPRADTSQPLPSPDPPLPPPASAPDGGLPYPPPYPPGLPPPAAQPGAPYAPPPGTYSPQPAAQPGPPYAPPPGTYSPPTPGTYPPPYAPDPGSYPRPYAPSPGPHPAPGGTAPPPYPYAYPPAAGGSPPHYGYPPSQPQWYAQPQPAPGHAPTHPTAADGTATLIGLVVAAVVSLAYAGWAFTARRAIFADFSAGRAVTTDDARASDTIDTFLLVVAGITVVVAVALWLVRLTRRRTAGGGLLLTGLTLTAVGVAVVAVGIWLDGIVTGAATQSAQGLRGVTATVVCGSGFVVLAVGLLLGAVVVRGPGEARAANPPGPAIGHPWQT